MVVILPLQVVQEQLILEVEVEEDQGVLGGGSAGGSGGSGIVIVRAPGSVICSKPRYKHSYNITCTSWWL
jgi:hypothetical protein